MIVNLLKVTNTWIRQINAHSFGQSLSDFLNIRIFIWSETIRNFKIKPKRFYMKMLSYMVHKYKWCEELRMKRKFIWLVQSFPDYQSFFCEMFSKLIIYIGRFWDDFVQPLSEKSKWTKWISICLYEGHARFVEWDLNKSEKRIQNMCFLKCLWISLILNMYTRAELFAFRTCETRMRGIPSAKNLIEMEMALLKSHLAPYLRLKNMEPTCLISFILSSFVLLSFSVAPLCLRSAPWCHHCFFLTC